jgi:predicted DNA-binding transcriptional regulator YafY
MSKLFPKMVDKLHRIDQLIRMKATGQPHELANRLEISPSTLYEYIDVMRSVLLAPIRYCHNRRSYIYEKEGKLHIGFKNNQKFNRLT